jgi:hypothetical protein
MIRSPTATVTVCRRRGRGDARRPELLARRGVERRACVVVARDQHRLRAAVLVDGAPTVLRCRDRAAVLVSDDAFVLLGPLQVAAGSAVVRVRECAPIIDVPLWVAAGPRAALLEATGKHQRHLSRTLRVADSGERDVAPSCGLRRDLLRGGSIPDVGSARSRGTPEALGHAAGSPTSFGHRFAIVCLRGLQSQRNCGNPREYGDLGRARDSAANRPHSPVEGRRLKIVVSPVRVRVSPLPETPAKWPVSTVFWRPARAYRFGHKNGHAARGSYGSGARLHFYRTVYATTARPSTSDTRPSARRPSWWPVSPAISSQQRGARESGAQVARAGA